MTFAGSPFDSAPYSLTGQPTDKPEYFQQHYTFTLGGPLKIPGVWKGDSKTSFVFNYNGNHSDSPLDIFSTVPTPAARAGDFSSLSTPIVDPETGQPFPGNLIPASRIDLRRHRCSRSSRRRTSLARARTTASRLRAPSTATT
jgi:hypothetical protein